MRIYLLDGSKFIYLQTVGPEAVGPVLRTLKLTFPHRVHVASTGPLC